MKSIAKIMLFFIIVSLMFTMSTSVLVLAGTTGNGIMTPGEISETALESTTTDKVNLMTGSLMRYLLVIGAMAMVVVMAVYGVQWLTASPQQKAVLKEKAWSYLIGAILIFGGASIMAIIANAVMGAFKPGQ